MTRYLLDTNVLSEVRKSKPDRHVVAWRIATSQDDQYTSVLVIGEIERGITALHRRDPAQAWVLGRWQRGLLALYGERVLPVTVDVAREWGRRDTPDRLPAADALMAATAVVHGMTLVTRNVRHMGRPGVAVLNPFEYRD